MNDINQGIENRRKRALVVWMQMWKDYSHKTQPLTVDQIAEKYIKPNGKKYSRQYIYEIFRKLAAMGKIRP